jgi:predicted phage-related endonuclease
VLLEDGSKHLVEVKTTRSFRDWEDTDGKPILPPHYVVQVQWQLFVMGLDGCDVEAFCVGDDSRRSYRVPYDHDVAMRVVMFVQAWYLHHILGDKLPDNMPAEIAGLVWPAPREPESWLDATAEDRATMLRYDAVGQQVKELEAERDQCKDKLINRIQDHTGIDGLCSWRSTKRGRQFRSLL